MKQIKTIRLQNFQSHKDTVIDASTAVLVLSGESNQGKSAILKGLNWLMTNRPSGTGFISKWVKETNKKGEVVLTKTAKCSVSLTIIGDDGKEHTLTRLRSRDKNIYEVDGVELEAVGTSVPAEVSALLGMHECNVQSQDDTYFMLTLPPGQVATKLNELVHLDTIDRAYEYNKKGKLRCSALVKEWDGIVGEAKFALDGMKHIPELTEDAKNLQEKLDEYNDLQEKITKMKFIMEDYYNLQQQLKPKTLGLNTDMEKLADLLEDYEDLTASQEDAEDLLALYDDLTNKLKEIPEIEEEEINALTKYVQAHEQIVEDLVALTQMRAKCNASEIDLSRIEEALKDMESKLPKVCPTCGKPLDKDEI